MKNLNNKIIEIKGVTKIHFINLRGIKTISITENVERDERIKRFHGESGTCSCGAAIQLSNYNHDDIYSLETVIYSSQCVGTPAHYSVSISYSQQESFTYSDIDKESVDKLKESYLNMEN